MDGPRRVKRYLVNEVFYSLQGEGARAGTPNVFVRFAKCNLACSEAVEGFDCDTDFAHGDWMTGDQLLAVVGHLAAAECDWVIFTGGEPALQIDVHLVQLFRANGWHLAIETNGTRPLPYGLDWVCVSPKTPDDTIVMRECDEVKFVVPAWGDLPMTNVRADHYLLSPAAKGDGIDPDALETCVSLCLANPPWRLSVQQHKWWGVR